MGEARDPEEFFDVAERIIQSINAVFERDSSLDEFDIVPVQSQSNRSPVIHLNHKLALESWCVPFLYSHSFRCFTQLLPKRNYTKQRQHHFPRPQNQYQNGSSLSSVANTIHNFDTNLTTEDKLKRRLYLSRVLLLLSPDLTVAWNFRREAFNQELTTFQDELRLASLIASRKPKSSEGFSYRRWLLKKVFFSEQSETQNVETMYEIFTGEIQVVEKAASSYFSNYHAWNHRLWLLETFTNLDQSFFSTQHHQHSDAQTGAELKWKILSSEEVLSDNWIEKHVSDHSGFHYRQRLLMQLCQNEFSFEGKLKIIKRELENNVEFITRFPGHEVLWCHRRFILHFIVPKLQLHLQFSNRKRKIDDGDGNGVSFDTNPNSCTQLDMDVDVGQVQGRNDDIQIHGACNGAGTGPEPGTVSEEEIKYLKTMEANLVKSIYLANANLDCTQAGDIENIVDEEVVAYNCPFLTLFQKEYRALD